MHARAPHVAVVGGGVSGLAAAHRLRMLLGPDARITVVEQSDRLGGKLRTTELAGVRFDVGAEAFLHRKPEAQELINEVGLQDHVVHPTGAKASVHAAGRTHQLPAHTFMGVPASVETVRHMLSSEGALRVEMEPTLPPVELQGGDVAVGALMKDRFGSEVADRLVGPLLGGVYAGRADELGLRATMPQIATLLDKGVGSLLAAAAMMMPAPPQPRVARPPVFASLANGVSSLVDRLAEVARPEVRLGLPVRVLSWLGHGWRLEIGSAATPEYLECDGVVLAVPAPSARKLLHEIAPQVSAAYGKVEVASMAVVALALPPGTELPQRSGILIAEGERYSDRITPFTAKAFTFSSRKWSHYGDPVILRGSVGRHGETALLQRSDADLVKAVRNDLHELTGIKASPIDSVVQRWGGGLPQYGVGHVDLVETIERGIADVPGLSVAGATLHGVGVPACIASGDAAAARVAAHLLGRVRR
ncbi:protoporphyrinogen oxidase [Lentzea sp. HUAS12]|uniref:protoporphyrinogen oxidase n=1 Tax=Lentzea sp. HUAS12 TaxID=2951806 RepID=UPI0020A18DB1|nr:protoporphyrinogen oxidase [Lentzea sp. HUAS12]USX48065.1 protoporphyrinogen oxidase [Lentzea sp. HUAS12]